MNENFSLAFEYTLCCSFEELKAKYKYNGHANGISELDILIALKLNKMCTDSSNLNFKSALSKIQNSMNFTKIEHLDERRSSEFVLNNLNKINTNNISNNYLANRSKFDKFVNTIS